MNLYLVSGPQACNNNKNNNNSYNNEDILGNYKGNYVLAIYMVVGGVSIIVKSLYVGRLCSHFIKEIKKIVMQRLCMLVVVITCTSVII